MPESSLPAATLTRSASGDGKYAKQTGGRGQYGHLKIRIHPGAPGSGFVFENLVVGGTIPEQSIPAVEQALRLAARGELPGGCVVEDIRIELLDGSYHETDSSETAFSMAAQMAFENALKAAAPIVDAFDDDHGSFVTEPRRPVPAPRHGAIAVPEPD